MIARFQYQLIIESTDCKVHYSAPALSHNLSQKHPLGILHLNKTCMRNLMKIRDKRSGSIFFRILTEAMSRPMINDLWLGHVHINKYAKFDQILLCERIRAVSILCEFRP